MIADVNVHAEAAARRAAWCHYQIETYFKMIPLEIQALTSECKKDTRRLDRDVRSTAS